MNRFATLASLLVLVAVAAWFVFFEQRTPVKLGLDLRGGMRVTLEPDRAKLDGQTVDSATMDQVRDILENRTNSFGVSGTAVQRKGDDQVLVQLPGISNPEQALKSLISVAQLEFRQLTQVQSDRNQGARYQMSEIPGDPKKGEAPRYVFHDSAQNGKEVPAVDVIKQSKLILRGDALKPESRATLSPDNGQPQVEFVFKQDGAQIFADFTTQNIGETLAVVLDDQIISAPTIRSAITEGRGVIEGGFANIGEAKVLANLLNSGALPITLKPVETQYVGATLGQESVRASIMAGLAGLGLVLVFMIAYYWLPGVLACVALMFYALITFALFKVLGIILDLPGVTGFILSVGMAVDANILIFERMKEELNEGKGIHAAIDNGFSRAFSSILDSNVTTWIVCAILFWLGAAVIKGFAVTLALGVLVSMFTAITVTRNLLHVVLDLRWARNPRFYGTGVSWLALFFPPVKQGAILRVFEKRRLYLGLSLVGTLIALGFTAATPLGYGLKPGIDFTGGSVIEAPFYRPGVTREQVVAVLEEQGLGDAVVSVGRSEKPWTTVTLEATEVDEKNQNLTRSVLENRLPAFDAKKYTSSVEGKTFKAQANLATEVTEAQVRAALSGPDGPTLKGLKLTVTPVSHTGDQAIPVAIITSAALQPEQSAKLVKALDEESLGGGVVQPMFQQSSIGPSIAREITLNAFSSVFVASLAIVLYLAVRFAIGGLANGLKFGVGAVIALIHDVLMVIGLFALMGFLRGWKVDSLFVTAALTVIGFSVHDTIVVYDRIRENLHRRRREETFEDVSNKSITQTFDRSVNTSLTVLLVLLALVLFGGESIRLFNLAMLVGIAIGTYSSIFVASPMVVLMERAARRAGRGVPAPAAGGRPQRAPAARPGSRPAQRPPAPPRPRPAPAAGPVGEGMVDREAERPSDSSNVRGAARPGGPVKPRRKRRM